VHRREAKLIFSLVIIEPAINRIVLVVLAVCGVFIATATASSDVVSAISPDKKFTVELGDCNDFGCKAELKATGNQEMLASTDIEAFDPDDAHCRISAHWRDDSAAVALNIDNGRSLTDCVVFLLAGGKWRRLELPEPDMQKTRDANNEEGGKSLDYLTFKQWTTNGIRMHYQGNRSETDLTWRIVDKPEPHLQLVTPFSRALR
jgi:uncharacterized protein (DUF1684 family)